VYQQENVQDSVDVPFSFFALGASVDGNGIHYSIPQLDPLNLDDHVHLPYTYFMFIRSLKAMQ
jgi:hypothetical protein